MSHSDLAMGSSLRKNVEFASKSFPLPPAAETYSQDGVISLPDVGDTLELLFQFMYPQRQPDLAEIEFQQLAELAEAAETYQVYAAMASCNFRMDSYVISGSKIRCH